MKCIEFLLLRISINFSITHPNQLNQPSKKKHLQKARNNFFFEVLISFYCW